MTTAEQATMNSIMSRVDEKLASNLEARREASRRSTRRMILSLIVIFATWSMLAATTVSLVGSSLAVEMLMIGWLSLGATMALVATHLR